MKTPSVAEDYRKRSPSWGLSPLGRPADTRCTRFCDLARRGLVWVSQTNIGVCLQARGSIWGIPSLCSQCIRVLAGFPARMEQPDGFHRRRSPYRNQPACSCELGRSFVVARLVRRHSIPELLSAAVALPGCAVGASHARKHLPALSTVRLSIFDT